MGLDKKIPSLSKKDINRFWNKVTLTEDPKKCWDWNAYKGRRGYGQFRIKSFQMRANRVSFFIKTNIDPIGYFVCHTCDNPSCVNPDHLFLGDQEANSKDMVSKGRASRHGVPKEKALRGERQNFSKLTEKKVLLIRKIYPEGNHTYDSLSEKFGVNRNTIYFIINRKTWTHI